MNHFYSSVGIYTDGQMLVGSHWFQPLARLRFDPGCTVGMLVYVGSSSPSSSSPSMSSDRIGGRRADTSSSSSSEVEEIGHYSETADTVDKEQIVTEKQANTVIFNLNGRPISYGDQAQQQMKIAIPNGAPLYPTVSLFSANTRLVRLPQHINTYNTLNECMCVYVVVPLLRSGHRVSKQSCHRRPERV